MADFPENANINPVLPPPRSREPGKRKQPVGERDSNQQKKRRPQQPPDDEHVLDEYA